ncbi:hypothetical protein [Streptomyces sp. CAI-85]|nr:hypothetical protein [Streptomyces sp. CAI-85]NUV62599.1 hypothetical protein [Streptomyces sp. CAI-85]
MSDEDGKQSPEQLGGSVTPDAWHEGDVPSGLGGEATVSATRLRARAAM